LTNSSSLCRSRKTSITTGVVDRSETIKQETVDRLSPLTSTITVSGQFGLQTADTDFEKFNVDLEVDSSCLQPASGSMQLSVANGNIRRHTVGPGDVAHEQALGNPAAVMNFKFDNGAMGQNQIPINLPMLQNHPINTFTVKDQHLLKPPMVMGASKWKSKALNRPCRVHSNPFELFPAGGFGRRASDGGANLHIFYPTTMNNPGDDAYSRQNSREFMMVTELATGGCQLKGDSNMESGEDSNDEIQRYMHGRGCSKRHTVGCTDDLSVAPSGQCMEPPLAHSPIPSTSGMSQSGSSGRTRRTGLLTVMERPPGKRISLLHFLSSLHDFFGMNFSMERNFCVESLFCFLFFPF
jgi:serine/threonine-protein kinase SIK3